MNFMGWNRTRRLVISALAIVLSITIIAVSLYSGKDTPSSAPGGSAKNAEGTIKVLSYNIHTGIGLDNVLDLKRIGDILAASGAEVIGLQEVDKHWAERSKFEDQAKWLADYLKFQYAFGANLDRAPLKAGGERRQYGTAVLSKYPITDHKNTFLPSNLRTETRGEQRGILRAAIDVQGTPIQFYSTHLGLLPEERKGQTSEVVKLVTAQGGSAIIVGDLNAAPNTDEIKNLSAVFKDAFADKNYTYTFPADKPHIRTDYIFHTSDLQLTSSEVIRTLASDHIPVTAQFTFNKQPRK